MAEEPGEEGGLEIPVDFGIAEDCASAAIAEILESCAQQLYKSYIEQRAFPYAANRICDFLVSEQRLCFVRHDRGEDPSQRLPNDPPEDWNLEPEPTPSSIDSWARACVPIRKRASRSKEPLGGQRKTLRGGPQGKGGPMGKGGGGPNGLEGEGRAPGSRGQVIPLSEEREEDEEEAWMREMKEKEAKRKREDEARIKRKAAEEAEEEAKLAKVKGEMVNKPYTYDTDGNIIWVQPPVPEKLPNPTPALNYKLKGGKDGPSHGAAAGAGAVGEEGRARPKPKASPKGRNRGQEKQGFTDSFQRLTSQQPPMMEAMQMSPGVVLGERGRQKKGEREVESGKKTMSRKDYQGMVAEERMGNQIGSSTAAGTETNMDGGGISMTMETSIPDARDVNLTQGGAQAGGLSARTDEGSAPPPAGKQLAAAKATGSLNAGEPPDWTEATVSAGVQRPAQPPPALHNPRARREAIGYRRGERERIPTSGAPAAGFRNYFPPPPIGATMGHGLLPKTPQDREKEFFFPDEDLADLGMDSGDDDFSAPLPTKRIVEIPQSPKNAKMGGNIQAPNRELLKRLFR